LYNAASNRAVKIKKRIYFLLLIFIPVALIAFVLPVNKYSDQGIIGAIDCDGPLTVMLFLIPSYIVYGIGLFIFSKASIQSRLIKHILMCVVCLSVLVLIAPNTISAFNEHKLNTTEYKSKCGMGW